MLIVLNSLQDSDVLTSCIAYAVLPSYPLDSDMVESHLSLVRKLHFSYRSLRRGSECN